MYVCERSLKIAITSFSKVLAFCASRRKKKAYIRGGYTQKYDYEEERDELLKTIEEFRMQTTETPLASEPDLCTIAIQLNLDYQLLL